MLLYLDLNCFNRPFDDQSQVRIARETEAVLMILQRVVEGVDSLAWSSILTFENSKNPVPERLNEIGSWARRAAIEIGVDAPLTQRARELAAGGITPPDAAHLASAEAAGCSRFLSCDDKLIRRAQSFNLGLVVQNPSIYAEELRT